MYAIAESDADQDDGKAEDAGEFIANYKRRNWRSKIGN